MSSTYNGPHVGQYFCANCFQSLVDLNINGTATFRNFNNLQTENGKLVCCNNRVDTLGRAQIEHITNLYQQKIQATQRTINDVTSNTNFIREFIVICLVSWLFTRCFS